MVNLMNYRENLQTRVLTYQDKLRGVGINSSVSGNGEYYIEIKVPERIKIYTNTRAELKLVLPSDLTGHKRTALIQVWEKANGRTHEGTNVYVDGSYRDGKVGYGCVIIKDNELYHSFSGIVNDPDAVKLRNVTGEMEAVLKALEFCLKERLTKPKIHYDYQGLEAWATGAWRAKTPFTMRYTELVRTYAETLKIEWIKVGAHTGIYYNEMVDKLARGAI